MNKTALGIIPARYASSRFAGKALAPILGKPMLYWVWKRSLGSKLLKEIIIATDDSRIQEAAEKFGAKVVMTSPDHQSGTDRIAEVAANLKADVIVNIQGDEPLIMPYMLDELVFSLLYSEGRVKISTLMKKISSTQDLFDPNVVKLVVAKNGRILYFSRNTIPYPGQRIVELLQHDLVFTQIYLEDHHFYKHIGVYAFDKKTLLKISSLSTTEIEEIEHLEQLRFLNAGYYVQAREICHDLHSVDTPEDISIVELLLSSEE